MMKKLRIVLLAMITSVLMLGAAVGEAAQKTIAVTGVECSISSSLARQAAADLEAAIVSILVQKGSYNVVERNQLEHVIRELGLHSTGLISGDTAIKFGNMVGAQYTVVGNVTSATVAPFNNIAYPGIKGKIKFNFKFINNETGVIECSEVIDGTHSVVDLRRSSSSREALISGAATEVAQKIMKRIEVLNPTVGIVMDNIDDVVYIDLGRINGVRVDDMFLVYREGKAVIHPITKEVRSVTEKKIATLKVIEVGEDSSVCEIKKSHEVIRPMDKVRRINK